MIAGAFAFIPIDNASSVHTTIMANTQRIDEIIVPFVAVDFDLVITCPTTSDGCRILEIYFRENDLVVGAGGDVDLGAVTAIINTVAATVQADLNTQVSESNEAIAGVSGITIGGSDTLRIVVVDGSSESTSYSAVIFIQTEGNTAATAAFLV